MRYKSMFSLLAALALVPAVAQADWDPHRPDSHAPIGVMGDHVHKKGEWMVGYRLMTMRMSGNRDGTDTLSAAEVRQRGYAIVPRRMLSLTHMLGLMHAPTDWLTIMVMLPVQQNSMDLEAGMPLGSTKFTTHSAGLGDITATGLFKVLEGSSYRLQLQAGLGLPSGGIEVRDDTPMAADARLPYPMRLGRGSLAALPGATFLTQANGWSFGVQATGQWPLYRNQDRYRTSRVGMATTRGAVSWTRWLSTSLRAAASTRSNYVGSDPDLNPQMTPAADPKLRGGSEIDGFAGVNLLAPKGALHGHRVAIEFGLPLYQNLDGPQLQNTWMATAGWQYSF